MLSALSLQPENPSPSTNAIKTSGTREVYGLQGAPGQKSIDTSFVYEVQEAALTPDERDYFLNCVGSCGINDGIIPSGAELFARIEQHPDYYVGSSEEKLLQHLAPKLLSHNSIVTELGPGDGKKAEILFSLNQHLIGVHYQAIDTSGDFLEMTRKRVSAFANVTPKIFCGDFFCAPESFQKADTVLFLGTTISNFDKEAAKQLLTHIKSDYLNQGGTLILGQDSNHDLARLQHCYNDRDKHTATFVLNALRSIRRQFLPSLDLNKFEYHAYFDEENETMRMGILVRQDSVITSELGPISFKEGEFISVGQSRKYSINSIKQVGEAVGFSSIETFSAETGVNIHCMR